MLEHVDLFAQLKEELYASLTDLKDQLITHRATAAQKADIAYQTSNADDQRTENPVGARATFASQDDAGTGQSHLLPRTTIGKMHPENIYCSHEPDFAALASRFPYLEPHVSLLPDGRGALDFTSWDATCQLTRALLEADYQVQWTLPEGQLVPPLPNRLNYIHWLRNLLQLSSPPGMPCGMNAFYSMHTLALLHSRHSGRARAEIAMLELKGNSEAAAKSYQP
jgi:hypothetical protein